MMELTKQDTQKAKGIAILGMVMLHLFCRLGDLPYIPLIWIGEIPLIYYIGLFGDMCVPIYCFCSGYAHYLLKEKHGKLYKKIISKKLMSFLTNYWIVVFLFCLIGIVSGNRVTIPGTLSEFLGNIFLYRISYNGAWWFVVTYVWLTILSPILIKMTKLLHPMVSIGMSCMVYFVAYLFRFKVLMMIENPALNWIWQQMILLGTSQFGYMIGTVCRREKWFSRLRLLISTPQNTIKPARIIKAIICFLPMFSFISHCFVQSLIIAPLTACTVLIFLFCIRIPLWIDNFLLFMGKHSTSIWLVHMFFYLTLFEDFVYIAKYPPMIFTMMISICLCTSCVIEYMYQLINKWIKFF